VKRGREEKSNGAVTCQRRSFRKGGVEDLPASLAGKRNECSPAFEREAFKKGNRKESEKATGERGRRKKKKKKKKKSIYRPSMRGARIDQHQHGGEEKRRDSTEKAVSPGGRRRERF